MISFEDFVLQDDSPIYLQIIQYVKRGIVSGAIENGEEMISRRALSALLGVNPNTIQKAYAELERRGIIYSIPGRGSFISTNTTELTDTLKASILKDAEEKLSEAKNQGIGREDTLSVIDRIWR